MADIRRKAMIIPMPGQPPKLSELMEVVRTDEKTSTYDLDDGTQLRMRAAIFEVWHVIDEYDADGNPLYVVKAQPIMSVIAPDNMKQGGKGK
jgi:hypothetical protein